MQKREAHITLSCPRRVQGRAFHRENRISGNHAMQVFAPFFGLVDITKETHDDGA
jgi:hypothetical protein